MRKHRERIDPVAESFGDVDPKLDLRGADREDRRKWTGWPLLDEVATCKVTGEEETWSHTELWDVQANVDGVLIVYQDLQPLLATRDKELDSTLEMRFAALSKVRDGHRDGDGFVLCTDPSKDEVKELSD